MTVSRAPYMEWARHRPSPEVDLAGSNLLPCTLDDLPGAREALAIAGRYGVAANCVATAGGCSGANFLACAAILEIGDEVLIEHPAYDPLAAAARMLGAAVRFFERRFEEGYVPDADRVAAALNSRTRLVILSSPHNPSGVLASRESLDALGRVAEKAGVHVLVDEVYLDAALGDKHPPAASLSPAFI